MDACSARRRSRARPRSYGPRPRSTAAIVWGLPPVVLFATVCFAVPNHGEARELPSPGEKAPELVESLVDLCPAGVDLGRAPGGLFRVLSDEMREIYYKDNPLNAVIRPWLKGEVSAGSLTDTLVEHYTDYFADPLRDNSIWADGRLAGQDWSLS